MKTDIPSILIALEWLTANHPLPVTQRPYPFDSLIQSLYLILNFLKEQSIPDSGS